MVSKVRLLGIAPYENMRTLMLNIAAEYDNVEMTGFVGDLDSGVKIARNNFYNNYDAIISRGGTAALLRKQQNLPVLEIPISPFDIIRAMRLAGNVSGKYALVGFPNITGSAKILCELMQQEIDIYPIQNETEVKPTIMRIRKKEYRSILCDVIAYTTAMKLGLNVVLIKSGPEGIRSAIEEALQMYQNYENLREENRFLRSLIWNQINKTVVFNEQGELFFSTVRNSAAPIISFLREQSLNSVNSTQKQILKRINGMQYNIRTSIEHLNGKNYSVFFFTEMRAPIAEIQRGIYFFSASETEERFNSSFWGITGLLHEQQERIDQVNHSNQPLIICGEDGTCKEQAAMFIYLQSSRHDRPLVTIDCFLLNEKAWNYLLNHHNSPFMHSGNTVLIKNVDVLETDRFRQMLASLIAMDVCKRNRVILLCACDGTVAISALAMELLGKLYGITICLLPLRQRADAIPAIANALLEYMNTKLMKPFIGLSPEAVKELQNYEWPQNYTQFERVLQELITTSKAPYIEKDFTNEILKREKTMVSVNSKVEEISSPIDINQSLESINRAIIKKVLLQENGNQSRAAMQLHISRTTLWRYIKSECTE